MFSFLKKPGARTVPDQYRINTGKHPRECLYLEIKSPAEGRAYSRGERPRRVRHVTLATKGD
jgi:hypothetical protein